MNTFQSWQWRKYDCISDTVLMPLMGALSNVFSLIYNFGHLLLKGNVYDLLLTIRSFILLLCHLCYFHKIGNICTFAKNIFFLNVLTENNTLRLIYIYINWSHQWKCSSMFDVKNTFFQLTSFRHILSLVIQTFINESH